MKIAAILLLACPVLAQDRPGTGWKNVTGGVGGETWGYAGVTLLAAVPDRDEVLAGVSESGLWSSVDGGDSTMSSSRTTRRARSSDGARRSIGRTAGALRAAFAGVVTTRAAVVFFATTFFAITRFGAIFLAGAAFLGAAFLAAAFLTGAAFLAAAFLTGAAFLEAVGRRGAERRPLADAPRLGVGPGAGRGAA